MAYILPQPQVRQTGLDQAGFATGVGIDLLLKALLAGQLGVKPTSGMYTAPTGATTPISPAERVAPGQPGAGQPLAGVLNQQYPGRMTGTSGFGGFQLQPDLDRLVKQGQLQQSQAYTKYLEGLTTPGTSAPTNPAMPALSPEMASYLAKRALAGDAEADAILQAAGY